MLLRYLMVLGTITGMSKIPSKESKCSATAKKRTAEAACTERQNLV